MKKFLKIGTILFVLMVAAGIGGCFLISKSVPDGIESPRTAEMVEKMYAALNKPAWDSTRYLKWTFLGKNDYVWDKEANLAEVTMGKTRVLLDPDEVTGVAYAQNEKLVGEDAEKAVRKAWSNWCNDMFWMTAPYKVNDPGVTHQLVQDEKGDRLKVTYTGGGVTPGDIYVWEFDTDGKPKAYEMYVSVLPLKGIDVPWGGWKEISTGAVLSTSHEVSGVGMKLTNVSGGMDLSDVGLEKDIWAEIR